MHDGHTVSQPGAVDLQVGGRCAHHTYFRGGYTLQTEPDSLAGRKSNFILRATLSSKIAAVVNTMMRPQNWASPSSLISPECVNCGRIPSPLKDIFVVCMRFLQVLSALDCHYVFFQMLDSEALNCTSHFKNHSINKWNSYFFFDAVTAIASLSR